MKTALPNPFMSFPLPGHLGGQPGSVAVAVVSPAQRPPLVVDMESLFAEIVDPLPLFLTDARAR